MLGKLADGQIDCLKKCPNVNSCKNTLNHMAKSTVSAKAIFTYTRTGATAKRASRERPSVPIIGLSPERLTARQLALIWGVHTIHASEPKSFGGMIENACQLAKKEGIVQKGDSVVITAGAPIGVSGSTNNLRIAKIS